MAVRAEQPIGPAWQRGRVASWLVTVDHKRIGILYIATAGVFFAISGFLAILIRTQLARPDGGVVTGDSYNEVVTMHGTGMVFFVVVPILAGRGNFLVPLMIGAPDMAFPRMNNVAFWLTLVAFFSLMLSTLFPGGTGMGAGIGWTAYAPLSTSGSVGPAVDFAIFALHLAGVCEHVIAIDSSAAAVAATQANAARNGLAKLDVREANVFDALRELEIEGAAFDTIVLDPPAFAKHKGAVPKAISGYKDINLRALRLLNPGGHLITCTCSAHVDEGMFGGIILSAATDAQVPVVVVEKRMQARDHPVLLSVPETYYLKCFVLRRAA